MTDYLSRFVNWWLDHFRAAGTQGRVAMLAAPLLVLLIFGCCSASMLMALVSPSTRQVDVAQMEAASAATVTIVESLPATEDSGPTAKPQPTFAEQPTYTPLPTYTALPTHTALPTAAPPTSTPRPSATPVPPSPVPSATPLPQPTATLAPTWTVAPTAALLPTATLPLPTATQAASGELATVTAVIDGDTIEVSMNGASYRVRYIGMDTPEVGDVCGSEATQANAALVAGQTVRMVKDRSETDRYGRLLRYIYVGNTFVNGALVAGGWAVAKDYPPDTAMSATLHGLMAEGAGRGCALVAAPLPTQPSAAPPPASPGGALHIVGVNKVAEYVDIRNDGGADVNLDGWVLVSEKGNQRCGLGGIIGAGATLRIWAMASDAGLGGYNCGFGSNIWNNSESDPAVLIDPSGVEVSRW